MTHDGEARLEIEAVPSRWRRLVLAAAIGLVALLAPLQALAQESPWPLLALPALLLLPREFEVRWLRLTGDALWVRTAAGSQRGRLGGPASITALVVELPVRWESGAASRLVLWRDAVDDASYRRLVRVLCRLRTADSR